MASAKLVVGAMMMAVVATVLMMSELTEGQGQVCSSQLSSLNVCAQFVVPGTANQPNTECCAALGSVDHQCICNTIQIASRLPSLCNLAQLSCLTT